MKKYILSLAVSLVLIQPAFAQSSKLSSDQDLLQGQWMQACQNHALRIEDFESHKVTLQEMFFMDDACKTPLMVFANAGNYVLPQAGQMDFTFTSVTVRLNSAVAVNDFNKRQVCGFSDWTINVDKEVSGRSCEIFFVGQPQKVPTAGEMRYGIYHIDGDHLSFGKLSRDQNATTPDKRPTDFDPRYYTKIPHISP